MSRAVSMNPANYESGGAFTDDVDVTFTDVDWVLWDYDGKSDKTSLFLKVAMTFDKPTDDGKEGQVQHYSAGSPEYFVPTEDGKDLQAVGNKRSISNSCNAAIFFTYLLNAGFDPDVLDANDNRCMEGLHCHVIKVPQPVRQGTGFQTGAGQAEGQQREKVVLVVQKILAAGKPGTNKAVVGKVMPKAAVPAKAATKVAAPAPVEPEAEAADGDVGEAAIGVILTVLGENNGTVTKAALNAKVFKAMPEPAARKQVLDCIMGEGWLEAQTDYFTFDKKKGTITAV